MKRFSVLLVLSAILLHCCNNTWSQSKMRKGPYLIFTGVNTEMQVLCQLDTSLNCTLEWGTDTNAFSNSVITTESGPGTDEHQHIYTITGLIPATKYYYRVTENNIKHNGSFTSAPADTTNCIIFYGYGDTRSNPNLHDSLCTQMVIEANSINGSQSIILHAGDWNTYGNEWRWDNEFFNRNYPNLLEFQSIMPIMGTRGNHEDSGVEYHKYWPYDSLNFYYSFDYGPVHFAVIDQYVDYSDNSVQYAWLDNDLANTNKPWKFILLHEPAYTDESSHTNNISTQNYIVPLCAQYGVQAIIGGHNHFYAHCFFNNIHHFTLGGGGAPLYPVYGLGDGYVYSESTLHFAKFIVCNDTITTEIIRPDGTIADTVKIPMSTSKFEANNGFTLNLYPNPANDILNFEINSNSIKKFKLKVYNIQGEMKISEEFKNVNNGSINTSELSSGVYTFKFYGKGFLLTRKVIIE